MPFGQSIQSFHRFYSKNQQATKRTHIHKRNKYIEMKRERRIIIKYVILTVMLQDVH